MITIDGNSDSRLFSITDDDSSNLQVVEISDLTLIGGRASGFSTGGAIRSSESLTLRDSTITGNEAFSGGAVYLSDGSTSLFDNVTFSGNVGYGGGAVTAVDTSLTVNDSYFLDNDAGVVGGAIAAGNSTISGTGNSFVHNDSENAGAIYLSGGSLTIDDSLFQGNTTGGSGNNGGALYLTDVTEANISASVFTGNSADDRGGAIYAANSAISLSGSSFTTNMRSLAERSLPTTARLRFATRHWPLIRPTTAVPCWQMAT